MSRCPNVDEIFLAMSYLSLVSIEDELNLVRIESLRRAEVQKSETAQWIDVQMGGKLWQNYAWSSDVLGSFFRHTHLNSNA